LLIRGYRSRRESEIKIEKPGDRYIESGVWFGLRRKGHGDLMVSLDLKLGRRYGDVERKC